MGQRVDIALERIAEEVATRRSRRLRVGGNMDPAQGEDEGGVAQGVEGEGELDARLRDDDAGGGGADEARRVEHQRVECHRRAKRRRIDQARNQRQSRRLIHRIGDAEKKRHREKQLDGDKAGIGQHRE